MPAVEHTIHLPKTNRALSLLLQPVKQKRAKCISSNLLGLFSELLNFLFCTALASIGLAQCCFLLVQLLLLRANLLLLHAKLLLQQRFSLVKAKENVKNKRSEEDYRTGAGVRQAAG